MHEIWKDIENYEGLYQVSDLGRVRSLDRMSWNGKCYWLQKGRILKQQINRTGYMSVGLCKNCEMKRVEVHRIVAYAFIKNPDNLPVVNHKNEIKTDNRSSNLEWVTHKQNLEYSGNTEKMLNASHKQKCYLKASEAKKKPVIQLTKNGDFVAEYESAADAERKTGIKKQCICKCCLNRYGNKSAGQYIWKYKNGTD